MPEIVVGAATIVCNQSQIPDTPSNLIVTSQSFVTIDGEVVATVNDMMVSNIGTFGICKLLTATASGVPTPCAYVPAGKWTPGSTLQKIDGMAVLTANSKQMCGIGGEITVLSPGQSGDTTD